MENNKTQIIFIHGGDAFRDPEDLYGMFPGCGHFIPDHLGKNTLEELVDINLE